MMPESHAARRARARSTGVPPNRPEKSSAEARRIELTGVGVDREGNRYVKVQVGGSSTLINIARYLADRVHALRRLQRLGAPLLTPSAQRDFAARLERECAEEPTFRVATQVGGFDGVFIFPDGPVPAGRSDIEIDLDERGADVVRRLRRRGTLGDARRLFALFRGNSRLMTGAALAFVGPMATVAPIEHVGVQYVGPGGDGKSTAAIAVSSIWGWDPDPNHRHGYGTRWRCTENAREDYMAAANNTLGFLDEAHSALGRTEREKHDAVLNAVKDIEGGKCKGRQTETHAATFFTPLLSTSNVSVPAMLLVTGRGVDYSYVDRLFDIPRPSGAPDFFETLHGFRSVEEFRDELIARAERSYGCAGREFVAALSRAMRADRRELSEFVRARRRRYVEVARERIRAPGRHRGRLHGKFATIFAAGCLAIRFGILPFTARELLWAILKCERDHVAFVAREFGALVRRERRPVDRLAAFVRDAEFLDCRRGTGLLRQGDVDRSSGVIATFDGRTELWLTNARFERIAGGKAEARRLKEQLWGEGRLFASRRGGRVSFVVKRPFPGLDRQYVVALRLVVP